CQGNGCTRAWSASEVAMHLKRRLGDADTNTDDAMDGSSTGADQRSYDPHERAEHMAAPTTDGTRETPDRPPSAHGPERDLRQLLMVQTEGAGGPLWGEQKWYHPVQWPTMSFVVRPAEETELDELAALWHQAWHDAHVQIVPTELTRLRPVEHFRQRIEAALANVRIVGPVGAPQGLCVIKGAELYQLFVARAARGAGVAAALIDDAEARLVARGVETAWLACAIGNVRAARFYEKRGWRRTGTMVNAAETACGDFLLEVWRYEKS